MATDCSLPPVYCIGGSQTLSTTLAIHRLAVRRRWAGRSRSLLQGINPNQNEAATACKLQTRLAGYVSCDFLPSFLQVVLKADRRSMAGAFWLSFRPKQEAMWQLHRSNVLQCQSPKKQPAGTSGPVTVPGQFIISSSALPLGLCLGICLPASLVHVLAYLERHQRSVNPPDLWTALALDDFVLAKGFFIFTRHMDMWNVNDTRTCPAIAMEGWCDLFFSLRSMISPG